MKQETLSSKRDSVDIEDSTIWFFEEEDVKDFIQRLRVIEEKYNNIVFNLQKKGKLIDIYVLSALKQEEIDKLAGEELTK